MVGWLRSDAIVPSRTIRDGNRRQTAGFPSRAPCSDAPLSTAGRSRESTRAENRDCIHYTSLRLLESNHFQKSCAGCSRQCQRCCCRRPYSRQRSDQCWRVKERRREGVCGGSQECRTISDATLLARSLFRLGKKSGS